MSDTHANDIAGKPAEKADEYIVVARRYRPQGFEELIGQGHVAQALKQAIASGRVGHAYLFTGARGVGKTSAARILAKALNCTNSPTGGPTETPCNECDVCRSVAAGNDVDVLEIDGASNRGIDEIRQLRQNVAIRPSRARFKVYIIDEVHMLTKEAFNALLKTLEEPPEHVKFIFATTEPNKIPITILSRCQRFDFAGIESTAIQARLAQIAEAEGVEIEDEALQILAMRAAGSMRDSQSLLEQLLAIAEGRITAADVNGLLGIASAQRVSVLAKLLAEQDSAAALYELSSAISDGADVGQLLDQLLGYFRDALAVAVGSGPESALYALPSQHTEVQAVAESLGVATLLAVLQVLDETAARLRVSVHTRTLAEMAVVRVCQLGDLDDLAAVIAALKTGQELPERAPRPGPAAPKRPQPAATSTPVPAKLPRAAEAAPAVITQPEPSTPTAGTEPPAVPSENRPLTELSEGQLTKLWAATAEGVGGLLGAAAALASNISTSGADRLVVRFDQPGAETCQQPSHKQQLEVALSACAGRKLHIEFEYRQASPAATASGPRRTRRQQLAEAAQHPFVKSAMELFDVPPDKLRYTPPPEGA